MVPFSISKKIGDPNAYSTSDVVKVVSAEAMVVVSVSAGTIVLDGIDSNLDSVAVSNGAEVAVRLKSSSQFGHTVYSVLSIEDRKAFFSLTTRSDTQLVYDYSGESLPLQFQENADHRGEFTWQPQGTPRLHVLNGTTWNGSIDLSVEPTGRNDKKTYGFLAGKERDRVYRIDLDSLELAQAIELDSPVSIGRAVIQDEDEGGVFNYYVALSSGSVVRLDPVNNYAVTHVATVGTDLVSVVSDTETNSVWVTCCESDTVTRITIDEQTGNHALTTVNLPTNSKPGELCLHGTRLLVSLFLDNSVAIIDTGNLTVETVKVSDRPYGVAVFNNIAYVTCSVGIVCALNLTSLEVSVYDVDAVVPASIDTSEQGAFVLDVEKKQIVWYDYGFAPISRFNASTPIEVVSAGTTTYLYADASNARSMLTPLDNTPTDIYFDSLLDNNTGETVLSNEYVVAGVNWETHASVDPISGASIEVNGEPRGSSTNVFPGDVIRVAVPMPEEYEAIIRPNVTLGTETIEFVATTLNRDLIPESIVFTPIEDATPDTAYTSNAVIIEGITEGAQIEVSAVDGTLIVNGVETGPTTVTNGDTVALTVTSPATGWSVASLIVGPIVATFSVSVEDTVAPDFTLTFLDRTDVEPGKEVFSNEIMVPQGLLDVPVELFSTYGAKLLVNGELVEEPAALSAGDMVQVGLTTTPGQGLDHVIVLNSTNMTSTWTVTTKPDITPTYFDFPRRTLAYINTAYPSDTRTIEGMTIGAQSTASVFPECVVILNGERLNDKGEAENFEDVPFEFVVENGDEIQLEFYSGAIYGSVVTRFLSIGEMTTSHSIKALAVNAAYENPNNYFWVLRDTEFFSAVKTVRQLDMQPAHVGPIRKDVTLDPYPPEVGRAMSGRELPTVDPVLKLSALRHFESVRQPEVNGSSSYDLDSDTAQHQGSSIQEFESVRTADKIGSNIRDFQNERFADKMYGPSHEVEAFRIHAQEKLASALFDALQSTRELRSSNKFSAKDGDSIHSSSHTGEAKQAEHVEGALKDANLNDPNRLQVVSRSFGSPGADKSLRNIRLFKIITPDRTERTLRFFELLTPSKTKTNIQFFELLLPDRTLSHIRMFDVASPSKEENRIRMFDVASPSKEENRIRMFALAKPTKEGNVLRFFSIGGPHKETKEFRTSEEAGFHKTEPESGYGVKAAFRWDEKKTRKASNFGFRRIESAWHYGDMHEYNRYMESNNTADIYGHVQFRSRYRDTDPLDPMWSPLNKPIASLLEFDHRDHLYRYVSTESMREADISLSRLTISNHKIGVGDLSLSKIFIAMNDVTSEYGGLHIEEVEGEYTFSYMESRYASAHWDPQAVFHDARFTEFDPLTVAIASETNTGFIGGLDPYVGVYSGSSELLQSAPYLRTTTTSNPEKSDPQPKHSSSFESSSRAPVTATFTAHNVTPSAVEFDRNSNETFEDKEREILSPPMMHYHPSAEYAYAAALLEGVDESRIQTHELYPDCWVWAEVLDQPDLCEIVEDIDPESGWIKGG